MSQATSVWLNVCCCTYQPTQKKAYNGHTYFAGFDTKIFHITYPNPSPMLINDPEAYFKMYLI